MAFDHGGHRGHGEIKINAFPPTFLYNRYWERYRDRDPDFDSLVPPFVKGGQGGLDLP